jgi:hypothetical protein
MTASPVDVHTELANLPKQAWTPAYQARKPRAAETGVQIEPCDGAWVAEGPDLTRSRVERGLRAGQGAGRALSGSSRASMTR